MKILKKIYLPIALICLLSVSIYGLYSYKSNKKTEEITINTAFNNQETKEVNTIKYELENSEIPQEEIYYEKEIHSEVEILSDLENNMSFLNEVFKETMESAN